MQSNKIGALGIVRAAKNILTRRANHRYESIIPPFLAVSIGAGPVPKSQNFSTVRSPNTAASFSNIPGLVASGSVAPPPGCTKY